jgi:phosphohistidine phosphatase
VADRHTLYIVRHAVAEERGPEFPDDTLRPLTGDGVSRFRKAVAGLADLEVEVDVILSSPLARARQTADLLSKGLAGHPSVVETGALSPGAPHKALLAELGRHRRKSAIALVGHEPHLGETAARLVGCPGRFDFRKGGVCRIDVDAFPPPGPGQLQWFAPPKLLIRLRRPR